jgi:hypothetical protein
MENAIDRIGLLRDNEEITVSCFYYDSSNASSVREEVEICTSDDPSPTSVMWTIPFGQSLEISIPLDFALDAGSFPLEIELSGDENDVPTLYLGWQFSLGFGYDANAGFFLYTVRIVLSP